MKITNEVTLQLYGDGELQETILSAISKALGVDVEVRSEKDYVTKKGAEGHYMQTLIKLN